MASYYEILGLDRDCSLEHVRRAYHQAARQHHPDKHGEASDAPSHFHDIQEAYETLRDEDSRAAYDAQLVREKLQEKREQDIRISEEVPLCEMKQETISGDSDDEVEVIYLHQCRCGDSYEISQEEIEDGIDVVPCTGCSLNIRVTR